MRISSTSICIVSRISVRDFLSISIDIREAKICTCMFEHKEKELLYFLPLI